MVGMELRNGMVFLVSHKKISCERLKLYLFTIGYMGYMTFSYELQLKSWPHPNSRSGGGLR